MSKITKTFEWIQILDKEIIILIILLVIAKMGGIWVCFGKNQPSSTDTFSELNQTKQSEESVKVQMFKQKMEEDKTYENKNK